MAKHRLSFVTNSSSSSFVIAIRNDATNDDIRQELMKQENNIKRSIDDYDTEGLLFDKYIDEVIKRINGTATYGIKLDNWNVGSEEFTNEDDTVDNIIYCLGAIDSEKVKVWGT